MQKILTIGMVMGLLVLLGGCVTEMPGDAKGKRTEKAVQTRIEAGNSYLADGNRELARRQFVDAIKMDASAAEAYLGVAQVHQANREFSEADANFKKALGKRAFNGKSAIQFAYGQFLFERTQYKDAIKYFELAGKDYDYGKRPLAIYFHGRCLVELAQPEKASEQFQHAVNLREDFGEPYLEMALLAYTARDYSRADEHYQQFIKYSRHSARSLWLGIRLARTLGQDDRQASYALQLKNMYGQSQEYLDYQRLIGQQ